MNKNFHDYILRVVICVIIILLSGCTFFSTRTESESTTDTNMVRQETWIKQEYHDGKLVELKSTGFITEVSKDVAEVKMSRSVSVPIGGSNLVSMISGGGISAVILGWVGKKMWERRPPARPEPPVVKGRSREDDEETLLHVDSDTV